MGARGAGRPAALDPPGHLRAVRGDGAHRRARLPRDPRAPARPRHPRDRGPDRATATAAAATTTAATVTSPPTVPLRAIAALFLERQHLRRPRRHAFSPARVGAWLADTGGLQLDSINVIDRAHYLTVWSRFGAYDRAALDD